MACLCACAAAVLASFAAPAGAGPMRTAIMEPTYYAGPQPVRAASVLEPRVWV